MMYKSKHMNTNMSSYTAIVRAPLQGQVMAGHNLFISYPKNS
jgi:hypothetical protein